VFAVGASVGFWGSVVEIEAEKEEEQTPIVLCHQEDFGRLTSLFLENLKLSILLLSFFSSSHHACFGAVVLQARPGIYFEQS